MFNAKKPDGIPAPASNAEAEKSGFRPSTSSAHSVVDACLTMNGDLESEGDILVKGKVIGNIRCNLLIIEVDALVEGGVHAEEVVVRGNTKGTLKAERVRLEKTANVDSEIYHRSFAAEEGARIKGTLQCMDEAADRQASHDKSKQSARTKPVGAAKEQPPLNGQTEPKESTAA